MFNDFSIVLMVSKLPITLKLGTIVLYTESHDYLRKFVHFLLGCFSEPIR